MATFTFMSHIYYNIYISLILHMYEQIGHFNFIYTTFDIYIYILCVFVVVEFRQDEIGQKLEKDKENKYKIKLFYLIKSN